MNWNSALLLLTVISCASLLWRSVRRRGHILAGWLFVTLFILLILGIVRFAHRGSEGYTGFGLWMAMVLLPSLLWRRSTQLATLQRFSSASVYAHLAAALHPFDGWREEARLLTALKRWQQGDVDTALEILQQISAHGGRAGFVAECHRLRIEGQWRALAAWFDHAMDEAAMVEQPELFPIYLRSLGEIGRVSELLDVYARISPVLDSPASHPARLQAMFFALIFGGKPAAAEALLGQLRPRYSAIGAQVWIATANLVAGNESAARAALQSIIASPGAPMSQAARQRLESPPPRADNLPDRARWILDSIEDEALAIAKTGPFGHGRRPWITYALILANIIVFIIEKFAGGTENDAVLLKLGALDIDLIAKHQYWRLLAANFLHAGWEHILFNMFALLVLGPTVEASVGVAKFLLIYFASALGSTSGVMLLQHLGLIHRDALVGASGAIMGLVGATGAILLRQWLKDRRQEVRSRLVNVVWIILLQAVFDYLTPQISSSAHLIGAAIGFLTALVLFRPEPRTRLRIAR